MANALTITSKTLTIYLLFLAIIFNCANSARLLDEVEAQPQVVDDIPQPAATTVPSNTLSSGQVAATTTPGGANDDDEAVDPPLPKAAPATATPVGAGASPTVGPTTTSTITGPGAGAEAASGTGATMANTGPHDPALSFFMHDILGGSHPSARVVSGIIANSEINGIPFSKTNNNIFPIQGAAPLLNGNNINNLKNINNLINSNNVPFLAGLTGAQTNAILQNTGNSNNVLNNNQPFVTAGQLPAGSLQRLMFGSITVIDDELTEAHELGSAVLGKAQGFYLASSLDGTSQTIAMTVLLHGGEHDHVQDTISFFGVHRTVSPESQISVVGGTGKYENVRGYATVETLHVEDQHITDGVDTILHFNVYLLD